MKARTLTLDLVEQDFKSWRKGRCSRTSPIPSALWEKVAAISSQYKNTAICRRLGLSYTQFKRKALRLPPSESASFVTATPPGSTLLGPTIRLSLSGAKRKLELSVHLSELDRVLPHLAAWL